MLLSCRAQRLDRHGTGHHTAGNSPPFKPLASPLEASQNLGGRELVWRFDGGDITSDGGVLVLKKLEQRTGIVCRFAACFIDYRKADQIEHPLLDLIRQRVFGLALGYEDLNDHDDLRRDPMLAVALGKDDPKGEQRRRQRDRGKAEAMAQIAALLPPGTVLITGAVRAPEGIPDAAVTRAYNSIYIIDHDGSILSV